MSNLRTLFQSSGYQAFMKKLVLYAVIEIVIGVLFLFMHWPGGKTITIVGVGTLMVWAIFDILEKITMRS